MTKLEKVRKGLEACAGTNTCEYPQSMVKCLLECPYKGKGCIDQVMYDTIELLKEREPKPVELDGEMPTVKYGKCPHCGEGLNSEVYPHWCGFCGQAVTWNA